MVQTVHGMIHLQNGIGARIISRHFLKKEKMDHGTAPLDLTNNISALWDKCRKSWMLVMCSIY